MGSGKKGGGKISGKYPVSVDENMVMIQGLGEMNLDACDSGDWLMINHENGIGVRNHPANQPPRAWGQPGMLNHPPKSWGQQAMLGRPGTHDHVSRGDFHTPTATAVQRPPNFVSNKHGVMMAGNPVCPPPWSHGQGFNARNGYDGNGIKSNGGSKRPLVVDSDDEDDDADDAEDEEGYSASNAKNVTQSKGPILTKGVHQSLTTNSWCHPGVGVGPTPKPYMNMGHGPSAVSHPRVGYHGWRPAGGGMMPMPMPASHFPPPPFPLPPLRSVGNFAAGDQKRNSEGTSEKFPRKNSFGVGHGNNFDDDFDDDFDEDLESEEDENIHTRKYDQNGRVVHGQVNLDPRLGMPPQLKNTWNLTNGGGGSQRQAYCNPSYINGNKSIVPRASNTSPNATSCKSRVKTSENDVEILSDSESADTECDEESEFDDNADDEVVARPEFVVGKSEKSRKRMEDNSAVKQISRMPKDVTKEVKQSRKHHEECGEATGVCASEQLQMKAEKVAEQPNVHASLFEDYKNRVKEVAKLVKFHITPKPEVDTCAPDKEQLMKIHEEKLKMKRRHQEEELELEKQFAVALRRFMEKQTTVNTDSDASSEL